ncbi:MAG: hypothetical protein JWP09_549 [Candidatus Taylorbacteria bacterium]|nr:hypothetical protein [Candidatus Taylorbacteria bacterium]
MITKIITHNRPHADELVALMLLKKFGEGEEKFPGVSTAEVQFLGAGKLPENKTYLDFPDTIFLGVGGGPFDEHATVDKERESGEVCATLVAKYLGIDNKPELQGILNIIKEEDLAVAKDKDMLSIGMKFLHSCFKDDYEKIYRWAEIAYMAHIKFFLERGEIRPFTVVDTKKILEELQSEDLEFWSGAIEEARKYQNDQYQLALKEFKGALKERFVGNDGQPIDMAVVTSDNEEVSKAFRSQRAQLIIQFSSRGNVSIFTYQKRGLDLTNSIMLLRMAEQFYKWGEIKIEDKSILGGEGMIDGIPWYLFHTKDSAFNGSLTTKDVPPTMIPHSKVADLIVEGLKAKF